MTSPFSDVPRVQYTTNPLVEVVCQVRFPTILAIEETMPTKFQESVRTYLPGFEEERQAIIQVDPTSEEIVRPDQIQRSRVFRFLSADKTLKLALTHSFLALSCTRYDRFERFLDFFMKGWDALEKIYAPSHAVRIGLRYIDRLQPSMLGKRNKSWVALLNPVLAAELEVLDQAETIEERTSVWKIGLQDKVKIKMRHGFLTTEDNQLFYNIDSDFFVEEQRELDQVHDTFEKLHGYSGKVFRWAISDALHKALKPIPIE